ncbi:MAG: hypothetical protein J6V14_05165, partial [Clostridia bacterium]|nr:hypothetical protein [Clostridia bacterium]
MTPDAKKALKRRLVIVLCAALAIAAVYFTAVLIYKGETERKYPSKYIDRGAVTVAERFRLPEGFERDDSEISRAALKKFGLAAYYADGTRNYNAGLWGVFADIAAALPAEFSPYAPEALKPGAVLKISKISEDNAYGAHYYLVADLCRDAEGNIRVLLAVYEPGCEVYITVPAETGAEKYAGCWFDLSRSFPEAGWSLETGN